MVWHFALSINPIMFSGVHILMNGKSDMSAICTASAVLPQPTGPKTNKRQHNENNDNLPSVRLWASSLDDLWGRLSLRHKRNLTLVKPVCKTAPKSFFGPPPAYQHLSTCHNWSAKKAIHDFLPIRIKGNSKRISGNSFSPFGVQNKHRVFSHDVTAAILVFQNNERAAMLVYQDNPVGVEIFPNANASFCSNEFAQMLARWVKTLYIGAASQTLLTGVKLRRDAG